MIMKNIGSKILILGFVIAVAVAGVLVFYPTIVTSPVDVPVNNTHLSTVETTMRGFAFTETIEHNDSLYDVLVDKLDVYKGESFLTEEQFDQQALALVRSYVPIFVSWCDTKFSAKVWYDADHKRMTERIAEIRTLTIGPEESPVSAVAGKYNSDLAGVESVLKNYKAALNVASYSTFVSVLDANNKIKEAYKYSKTEPLSNCEALVTKLADVKTKVGKSHFKYVDTEVEKMASVYRTMTEADFNEFKEQVRSKINEYDSNRYNYGSDAKTSDDLWKAFNENSTIAHEYYNYKEIYIYTNNSWEYISSPDYSYRALRSYSNYNKHNSDAIMYFTISGYEEFTFYIRSNGESNFDYVMVGNLNSVPNTGYNYRNTYGKSNGNSSFNNYTPVMFSDLNKDQTYTIYVVYHKDGSNNYYSDRGYVLIPYANN